MRVDVFDAGGRTKRWISRAHDVLRKEVITRGTHPTAKSILGSMQDRAPRLTGAMASKLTVDGGVVGILDDSEAASVALYNEFSPNHQPFMRPAARANESTLDQRATAALQSAERLVG